MNFSWDFAGTGDSLPIYIEAVSLRSGYEHVCTPTIMRFSGIGHQAAIFQTISPISQWTVEQNNNRYQPWGDNKAKYPRIFRQKLAPDNADPKKCRVTFMNVGVRPVHRLSTIC